MFNDWDNIQLDFLSNVKSLGNSYGASTAIQYEEISYKAVVAILGGFDPLSFSSGANAIFLPTIIKE